MDFKRVTLFAGHYGSGKTNIAINYALMLKKSADKVAIADIDIVNPYFRTKDSEAVLKENNIKLISSEYANTNVDVPALPPQVYSIAQDFSTYAVIDVGGDDRGALALGRYAPMIISDNNYNMFLVINMYRPLTKDAKSTVEVMREIETAGGIKFTGIVNNSNLGEETTSEDVLKSVSYADEVSKTTGLKVYMTTVRKEIFDTLNGKIENLVPITMYVDWKDRI